jgi:hypothetical protein
VKFRLSAELELTDEDNHMQGATEYARMFTTGQYGRLYLVSDSHARGETFHIWVLPPDAKLDGESRPWSLPDAVEVYGIIGGQPGWTETYGWLHKGKWQEDFATLVESRRATLADIHAQEVQRKARDEKAESQRKAELLARY